MRRIKRKFTTMFLVLRDLFIEKESIRLLDTDETMKTDIYKIIKKTC